MTLDEYQNLAMRTAGGEGDAMALAVASLGLAGEAGEVVELVKKHLGHGHGLDREKLQKELGDVLWYVARVADWADLSLGDIAAANVAKLRARYPAGFSHERSVNRDE